jgi:Pentapeptide repeats (8 copies)
VRFLAEADMVQSPDLSEVDLSGVNLSGVELSGAILVHANPSGAIGVTEQTLERQIVDADGPSYGLEGATMPTGRSTPSRGGENRVPSDANSSRLCCVNSTQIGLVEADESRLVDRDTQVDLKHGLEHRPRYPLSVEVDATRNAGANRLEEIFVTHGDDENLAVFVLQVPALQLAIGGGVQADPQRPMKSFS